MSQLTREQQVAQRLADDLGREYVTKIDGRIAIILRELPGETAEETADRLSRIVRAIEAAS